MSNASDEADMQEILDELARPEPRSRAIVLQVLAGAPTGDARVRERVREMLKDRTPTVLSLPYQYGEIRWLAAHALAAEERAVGRLDSVVITDVPFPLGTERLAALASEADLTQDRGGHEGMLTTFRALRSRGLLPLTTLKL